MYKRQLELLEPEAHAAIATLAREPERLDEIFPTLKKDSVDYAIMEPVAEGRTEAHVVAVALDVSWRDVGGFHSLAETLPTDADGNASNSLLQALGATDNIVLDQLGGRRLIALLGVSDLVVVETPDATLIAHRDQAEKVKALVAAITESTPDFS